MIKVLTPIKTMRAKCLRPGSAPMPSNNMCFVAIPDGEETPSIMMRNQLSGSKRREMQQPSLNGTGRNLLPGQSERSQELMQPGYLTLKRAAEWASISEKTLMRWIGRGLPVYQAGPRERVLLKAEDINRFLTCKKAQSVDLNQLVDEVMADLKLTNGN